jgi:hypothetical protein
VANGEVVRAITGRATEAMARLAQAGQEATLHVDHVAPGVAGATTPEDASGEIVGLTAIIAESPRCP